MNLRADHVAGGFFIAFGLLVIALSGDLPMGTLSLPGSGFMPKILAALTIVFGITLMVRATETKPFASLSWHDAKHAALVVAITGVSVLLFERIGFLLTETLLIFALLIIIEKRGILPAAAYSIGLVGITYILFVYALNTPLVTGPLGF